MSWEEFFFLQIVHLGNGHSDSELLRLQLRKEGIESKFRYDLLDAVVVVGSFIIVIKL